MERGLSSTKVRPASAEDAPPQAGKQTRSEAGGLSGDESPERKDSPDASTERMGDWDPESLLGAMGLQDEASASDGASGESGESLQLKSSLAGYAAQEAGGDGEQPQQLGSQGLTGTPGALPHQERIQQSFGGHDVSGVRSFVGGPAASATESLGAQAYAMGDSVAFREEPDLHTAAHEAAHVVQQRAGVQLKGGMGKAGDEYEQHADAVADRVVRGESAEALLSQKAGPSPRGAQGDSTAPVQASFISFVVKMGAKKSAKALLEKFIREQIKGKIAKIAIKKYSQRFAKEAQDILDMLDDPWWATAIGFIPIVGDVFDLARVPKKIQNAIKAADRLETKVKHILHIQGRRASELLPATLQRSESYAAELAEKTYAELVQLSGSNHRAAQMKKLIENEPRLMEKLK
jgi:Domain of unknown function (DUF4157)